MRIGIDALSLIPGRTGGIETAIVKIVDALGRLDHANEYVVLALPEARERLDMGYPNVRVHVCDIPRAPGFTVPIRLIYEQLAMQGLVRKLGIDVVFYPASIASWWCSCNSVLMLVDLIASYYADHFPGRLGFVKERMLPWMMGQSARRATKVVAISEFTKQDVCKRLHVPAERIEVLYLGVDERAPQVDGGQNEALPEQVREPYVLFVGYQHLHKNLVRLVRAFAQMKERTGLPHSLVLAGKEETGTPDLRQELQRLQSDSIVDLGLVSSSELSALHRRASLFVYPSLIEGFGLPPLDAMAYGVPVAAARAGAIPEVVGDAAILFDPLSEDDISAALERGLSDDDLRRDLIAKGYGRIGKDRPFSWERTAEQLIGIFGQFAATEARGVGGSVS